MRDNKYSSSRQQKLPFPAEEAWETIPESVREQCRTLLMQLLASVFRDQERVGEGDERED